MRFTTSTQHGRLCFHIARTYDRNFSTGDLEQVVMDFALEVESSTYMEYPVKSIQTIL